MVCDHLQPLEDEMLRKGLAPTFRGAAWSGSCREWVYFDVVFDLPALRARFSFAPCVKDHSHRGTHDGSEQGLVCHEHFDAIMGRHPSDFEGIPGTDPVYRDYLQRQMKKYS